MDDLNSIAMDFSSNLRSANETCTYKRDYVKNGSNFSVHFLSIGNDQGK